MAARTADRHAFDSGGKFRLQCVGCGWVGPSALVFRCPGCDGALEARMNLAHVMVRPSDEPEITYFDLLPLSSPEYLQPGASHVTPCRRAERLGSAIGLPQLWIKDESRQPTGSTKDRAAAIVLAVFRQFGIDEFACASTGNTAIALARAAGLDPSMRGHFFCGVTSAGHDLINQGNGNTVTVIDGSYTDALRAAREFALAHGIFAEGGFFSWARREGLKLAYLEAFDEMMPVQPHVVVQAISSGMGIMAARKAVSEYLALGRLSGAPQFLMVQQDTCAPMARAWREGRSELTDADVIANPAGLAAAILLGDGRASYRYMWEIASSSGGSIVDVIQLQLIEARGLLMELEGIDVCYSSAATVAAVRNEVAAGRLNADQVVLVNLTGVHRGGT
jgi:threonine synthase